MDLPHWLEFILIGVAVTVAAELIRPNFVERMKQPSGRIYLLEQLALATVLGLLMSVFTDSAYIVVICFVAAKGDAIINGMLYRAIILKAVLAKDEKGQPVLPLDVKSYAGLPVAEELLKKLGIKIQETRLTEIVAAKEATAASRAVATNLLLPPDIKKLLETPPDNLEG